jgi:IclR family pca regulon transcriptional regulator
VLDLGVAYVRSQGLWDVARPHMTALVERTHESCSVAQLDGSDVVYVARVAVPKIVGLSVQIGTRFPALATSLGKVLLAALPPEEVGRTAEANRPAPDSSRAGNRTGPSARPSCARSGARGWALTDQQLTRASDRSRCRCATARAGWSRR